MGKLEDIRDELHRMADAQFDGIKDCFNHMKQALGATASDDEVLDKLLQTMQQVSGVTQESIKQQLAATRERIADMEKKIGEVTDVR